MLSKNRKGSLTVARKKRTSKTLDKAQQRAAGLSSISSTLDLGNALTLAAYNAEIAATKTSLDAYNAALSAVDATYNTLQEAEGGLAALTERMLAGVAAKYGKDSNEYEMAGGTRKSERKRPTRKPPAA
jgi:hypothetical protein